MNTNLIIVLAFILVLIILFWLMNDKSANRVTKSLGTLSKTLSISKIIDAIVEYYKSKKDSEQS